MRSRITYSGLIGSILLVSLLVAPTGWTAESILIGVPTSLGFVEGREGMRSAQLAVEEINSKGGVSVGPAKMLIKLESLDIRDASPGVPVPEALLGLEKIILEKRPAALLVGPFRSEALMASMDIISKYKTPMLGTIAMSPASEEKIKKEPRKYKYIFRVCLNADFLVKYLAGTMALINKEFGFNRVFIMHQDVAWARATIDSIKKEYFEKAGWDIVEQLSYPTGSTDFSSALIKARAKKAQVILPIFDMPQSGILVKQWNSMKVTSILAGFISPLAGPKAWNTFDQNISGAINCNYEMGSAITSGKMPFSVGFEKAYRKRWGESLEAGHGPAPSYESVYILVEAIERAGTLDADALVEELEKTDRVGVMGRIKFDEGHQAIYDMDPESSAVGAVFQWNSDGTRSIVFPPALADRKIKLPEGLTPVN
jgi:branched-chain amino acid transport system substrate-binding protein